MYRFMSSVPAARKWIWRLVVICAGVNAAYILFLQSITLGNQNPALYASDPCMDFASCRYSTTAATVQFLRQSRRFLTTTAWEELRNIFRGRDGHKMSWKVNGRFILCLMHPKGAPRRGKVEATAAMAMVVK